MATKRTPRAAKKQHEEKHVEYEFMGPYIGPIGIMVGLPLGEPPFLISILLSVHLRCLLLSIIALECRFQCGMGQHYLHGALTSKSPSCHLADEAHPFMCPFAVTYMLHLTCNSSGCVAAFPKFSYPTVDLSSSALASLYSSDALKAFVAYFGLQASSAP